MKQQPKTAYVFTHEGGDLPIKIRKVSTSRSMVIRYQPLTHSLALTLPRYVSIKQGLSFIEEKRNWIMAQLPHDATQNALVEGASIPVLGKNYVITHMGGRGVVRIEEDKLIVPGDAAFITRRVRDWLKKRAREEISRLAYEKAQQLGKKATKISLRDTTSHWGSCTQAGGLSFSWRLVFAPYEVLEYVVCHEVAHLSEMNHSKAFWAHVAELCPSYEAQKRWLKRYGHRLYQYR
ncbi:MAG: M48 family metallopeptidase [Rickettsiales bacterium]